MSEDVERSESLDAVPAVPEAAEDSGAGEESAESCSEAAPIESSVPAAPTAVGAVGPDSRDRQRQRIADYQASSLNKSDPLEANIGFINADLMVLRSELHQAVIEVMQAPVDLNVLAEASPTLDTYLRVTKQIERFTQIERKFCKETGTLPVTKQPGAAQSEETSS